MATISIMRFTDPDGVRLEAMHYGRAKTRESGFEKRPAPGKKRPEKASDPGRIAGCRATGSRTTGAPARPTVTRWNPRHASLELCRGQEAARGVD
jgi:hypothetical protein